MLLSLLIVHARKLGFAFEVMADTSVVLLLTPLLHIHFTFM